MVGVDQVVVVAHAVALKSSARSRPRWRWPCPAAAAQPPPRRRGAGHAHADGPRAARVGHRAHMAVTAPRPWRGRCRNGAGCRCLGHRVALAKPPGQCACRAARSARCAWPHPAAGLASRSGLWPPPGWPHRAETGAVVMQLPGAGVGDIEGTAERRSAERAPAAPTSRRDPHGLSGGIAV